MTSVNARGRLLLSHLVLAGGAVASVEIAHAFGADRLSAALVALVASAILSFAVSAALAQPLVELAQTARAMAQGELARRSDARSIDERGEVARALNDIAANFERAMREVSAERNRLAAVLAGMVEGVLVVDRTGRIVLANPSLREILGATADLTGHTVLEAIRSADLHDAVAGALRGDRPAPTSITASGTPARTLEVRFSLLRESAPPHDAGSIAGLVAVFHDVTELKRLEQVRRDFVANASHELKTPIAAIVGASDTLAMGAADDAAARRSFLDVIARHASRLAALVQDLLDLSRIEARDAAEELKPLPVAAALARSVEPYREAASAKRLSIEVAAVAEGISVLADPTLLDRALANLVQNAVQYTPEGGRIAVRAVDAEGAVRFEIADTGIGIPAAALPRIFERFYRVDPARSRELGGTGLGLSIVKHAAEAMGGRVSVDSAPGRGSTFALTLRAAPPAPA